MNPYGPQMYDAPGGAQSRFCPTCRVDNPIGNTICRGCGSVMPEALAMPAPQAAPPWGCSACRKENAGHYEFCLGCGAARTPSGARFEGRGCGYEGNPAPAAKRSPVVLIVVIVVIAVLVLVAALGGVAAMFILR